MGTFFILSTLTLVIPSRSWMSKKGWRWGNGFYQGFWPVRKPISATWRRSYWWVIQDWYTACLLTKEGQRSPSESGVELCTLHCTQMVTNGSTWTTFWPPVFLSQPMKPLKAAATTSQPMLTLQQIETIFFKVPELHEIHKDFYDGLLPRVQQWSHHQCVGDLFQKLVSSTVLYCLI